MFKVVGQSSYDKFDKVIMEDVSHKDAKDFYDRHGGVYTDNAGFQWYLRVEPQNKNSNTF